LTWQDGTTFEGRNPGATYFVYVRSKESNSHNAGTFSVSTGINIELPGGSADIEISVSEIKDAGITLSLTGGRIILHRQNDPTRTVSVTGLAGYTISWLFNGIPLGTAPSLTLTVDQDNPGYRLAYDIIGVHFLTVRVVDAEGKASGTLIEFEVQGE